MRKFPFVLEFVWIRSWGETSGCLGLFCMAVPKIGLFSKTIQFLLRFPCPPHVQRPAISVRPGGGGASLDKGSKKKWRVSPQKTNFYSGASRRKLWAILGNVRELNRRKLLSIIKEKSLLQKNNNTSLFAHFNIYCIFKKYWGDAQFLNAPLTLKTQNAALRLPVAINQMNKCTNDDAHFSLNVC